MSVEEKVFLRISAIRANTANHVIWYRDGAVQRRTHAKLFDDIDSAVGMLRDRGLSRIGIIGPTCYNWLVLDLACLLGGFQSVAFPEGLADAQLAQLIEAQRVDILFVHETVSARVRQPAEKLVVFSSGGQLSSGSRGNIIRCRIRPDYSVIFSSGSTGLPKPVTIKFRQHNYRREKSNLVNQQFEQFAGEAAPLWKKRGNKMIIFMPFSHFQQRQFAWAALMRRCDLLLSSPTDALVHIIRERPNVMISVPAIYEGLASIIERELRSQGRIRRWLFRQAQNRRINLRDRGDLLRWAFDTFVVGRHIRSLYGGRADVFITGSAPIRASALQTLWSVGIRVYDVLSQTELGILAVNTPFDHRLGSVGKPFQDIKISDEGEIMVKFDPQIHDAALVRLDGDGYAHSGDMGRLDEDGYLYHEGRANSVMVLKNGKKLQPETIERALCVEGVQHAVLFKTDDDTLGAVLIVEDADRHRVQAALPEVLAACAEHERPRHVTLLERAGCPRAEFWTTSGKLVRSAVAAFGRRRVSSTLVAAGE